MYGWSKKFNKNESGQAALEAAIILIAFVVVASVFAFAILSAGSASTQKGEQAIYSGLEGVQSSLEVRGAVQAYNADVAPYAQGDIVFTVALVAGGAPISLSDTGTLISYRDSAVAQADVPFAVSYLRENSDGNPDLLEKDELAEIIVSTANMDPAIVFAANKTFTLEVKPPSGGVLNISRTFPAALDNVMQIR